jgi:hypothetical protein
VPVAEAVPLASSERLLAFVESIACKWTATPCFSALVPFPEIGNYIVAVRILDRRGGSVWGAIIFHSVGTRPNQSVCRIIAVVRVTRVRSFEVSGRRGGSIHHRPDVASMKAATSGRFRRHHRSTSKPRLRFLFNPLLCVLPGCEPLTCSTWP